METTQTTVSNETSSLITGPDFSDVRNPFKSRRPHSDVKFSGSIAEQIRLGIYDRPLLTDSDLTVGRNRIYAPKIYDPATSNVVELKSDTAYVYPPLNYIEHWFSNIWTILIFKIV